MGFVPGSMKSDIPANSYPYDDLQNKESPNYAGSVSSEASSDNASVDHGAEESYSSTPQNNQSKGNGKRARKLLTEEQSRVLHDLLRRTSFPSTQVRQEVAAQLGLSPRKVQVFFQNKRQKQRKKSTLSMPTQVKMAESQRMLQARSAEASPVQQNDTYPRNLSPLSQTQLHGDIRDVTPSVSLNTNTSPPSIQHYHPPQSLPFKWPHSYSEPRRAFERPYWHESRYDRKDFNASGFFKASPDLTTSRSTPPYTRELYMNQNASRILPPIVSNIRTSNTKLPSIDEVVSRAPY